MVWRPQRYLTQGQKLGVSEEALNNAIDTVRVLREKTPLAPAIFTLRHLAELADVNYVTLRAIVSRRTLDPYRVFRVKKRSSTKAKEQGYRTICVPITPLMKTQRWIAKNVLSTISSHPNSYAYSPKSTIAECARMHCNAQWLIKTDIRRFFESISEISVYHAFRSIGYQPLISLELTRIATRVRGKTATRVSARWRGVAEHPGVQRYAGTDLGHLPQGAPTSPMLSNIVACSLDHEIERIARAYDLRHTRYADDIILSSESKKFGRRRSREVIGKIYRTMAHNGFSPNTSKTTIAPPGTRKIVLGLLVDSAEPRLTQQFRDRLRQHCYYLTHRCVGPARHAASRGFESVAGLHNHIIGLLTFAASIDENYAKKMKSELAGVVWPL